MTVSYTDYKDVILLIFTYATSIREFIHQPKKVSNRALNTSTLLLLTRFDTSVHFGKEDISAPVKKHRCVYSKICRSGRGRSVQTLFYHCDYSLFHPYCPGSHQMRLPPRRLPWFSDPGNRSKVVPMHRCAIVYNGDQRRMDVQL